MWLLFKNSLATLKSQKVLILFLSILTMFGSATVSYGTLQTNTVSHAYNSLIQNSGEYNFIYEESDYGIKQKGEELCTSKGISISTPMTPTQQELCTKAIYDHVYAAFPDSQHVKRDLKLITPTDIDNGHFFMVTKNILTGTIAKNWTTVGRDAATKDEATVTPKYAMANNIKVGDKISIKNIEYVITGYTMSYDFAAPVININYIYPNFNKETVVYTTADGYDRISDSLIPSRDIDTISYMNGDGFAMNAMFQEYFVHHKPIINHKLSPQAHTIALRVTTIINQVESARMINFVLMIFILTITVLVMMIVIKNVIRRNKKHIGVLKALGYKSYQISFSYTTYAIVVGLLGGLLGLLAGYLLYRHYLPVFNNFFITNLYVNPTTLREYIFLILVPFLIIVLPVYLLTWFSLKKKALTLMSDRDGTKSNFLVRFTSKVFRKRSFKTRFKYAQAFKAPSRLLTMSFTILTSTILMLFMFSALNVFTDIFEASFGTKAYDGSIRYNTSNHTIVVNEGDVKEYDWTTFSDNSNLQGKSISLFQLREGYDELKAIMPDIANNKAITSFSARLLLNLDINTPQVQALKEQYIVIGGQVKEKGSEPYTYIKNKFMTDQNDRNFLLEEAQNKIKISSLSFYGISDDSKLFNVWQKNPKMLEKINNYKGKHWPVVINSFAATRANIKVGDVIDVAVNEDILPEHELVNKSYQKIEVLDIIKEYDGSAGYTIPRYISDMYGWYVNDDSIDANYNGKLYVGEVLEGTKYTSLGHPIRKTLDGSLENNYIYHGHVGLLGTTIKSEPILYMMGMYSNNPALDANLIRPLNLNYSSVVDLEYSIQAFNKLIDLTKASLNSYIIFAWFIAAAIIIITTIIIVDDNKKMIVTLKTLGYDNKSISKMVLTIYIPFLLFALIIAIPITEIIFRVIENALRQASNTELPLSISISTLIWAFIAVTIVYSASFIISYNKLKKIKLQQV